MFALPLISLAGNNDKDNAVSKSVSGKVLAASGEEIPAAKIAIKETNETFYADINGNFQFKVKSDRVYSIVVEGIGFSPKEIKSTELSHFSEISLKEL